MTRPEGGRNFLMSSPKIQLNFIFSGFTIEIKKYMTCAKTKCLQNHKNCDKLPLSIIENIQKKSLTFIIDIIAYIALEFLLIIIIHCKVVCIMFPLAIDCNIHVFSTQFSSLNADNFFFSSIECRFACSNKINSKHFSSFVI